MLNYLNHKYYVDKYGVVEPEMQINGEESKELEKTLNKQIKERNKLKHGTIWKMMLML